MKILHICAIFCAVLLLAQPVCAKSHLSSRHSGTEPPDGPRQGVLPGPVGHTDAYGYSLTDRQPEERKPRHRPRPGAYGGPPKKEAKLPELPQEQGAPVWNFR